MKPLLVTALKTIADGSFLFDWKVVPTRRGDVACENASSALRVQVTNDLECTIRTCCALGACTKPRAQHNRKRNGERKYGSETPSTPNYSISARKKSYWMHRALVRFMRRPLLVR